MTHVAILSEATLSLESGDRESPRSISQPFGKVEKSSRGTPKINCIIFRYCDVDAPISRVYRVRMPTRSVLSKPIILNEKASIVAVSMHAKPNVAPYKKKCKYHIKYFNERDILDYNLRNNTPIRVDNIVPIRTFRGFRSASKRCDPSAALTLFWK